VLISVDGVWDNVMKIKPPLLFSKSDADQLLDAAGAVLGKLQDSLTDVLADDEVRRACIAQARKAADVYFRELSAASAI
jgi:hypothetical protein